MQGSASTAGSVPIFGAASTLEYAGAALQTAGTEFRTPFPGTGGVVIDNANGVKLGATKTVTKALNLLSGQLDMNAFSLTVGDLQGTGTITSILAGAVTLTVGSANLNTTFSGTIQNGSGTVALTKNGTGTLTLSGNNSYSGLTTISAGMIKIGQAGNASNSPLGTTGSGTTITSGASLDLNGFTLGTAEPLILRGTGISASGSLTNTSPNDVTYSGLLTLGANSTIVVNAGDINITNPGSITGTFNLTLDGTGNGSLTSILSTATGTLVKNGTGTWTLSGANTYTGATTINAGTIKIGASASVLGTVAGITTVVSGAVLDLNGFNIGSAEPLTINGSGISGSGALINSSATTSDFPGLLRLGTASSIFVNNGDINLTATGTITGSGFALTLGGSGYGILASVLGTGAGTLTKTGTGTWTLSGINTYTGATTIASGTLKISGTGAGIPNNSSLVLDGILDLNGNNETVGPLTGLGILTSSAAGAITFTAGTATSTTFAGTIEDGSGTVAFTKAGTGALTLSGNNSYSGLTTISAGTIKLGAAGDGTNSPLGTIINGTTITAGAVLDLNGITMLTAEDLTIRGTGITSSGALTNSSATPVSYSGLLRLGSASSIIVSAGDIDLTNTGIITGSGFGLTLGGTGNGSLASILNTTTGTLTKSGTGTWILSGTNNHTGATVISAGILKAGASTSIFGTVASTTTVSNGAVLDLNGYNISTAETLILNGTGISGSGALTNTSATGSTYIGLLRLGSSSSIVVNNGSITLTAAGTITGAGFDLTLDGTGNGSLASIIGTTSGEVIKTGSGMWTLSGASTFTGGTTLNAGTLNINHAQALGNVAGTFTIAGGTIDNTTGAAITTVNYPQSWNASFSFTGTRNLNLGSGTITLNNNIVATTQANTLTATGTVNGSTYDLTKSGGGALNFGSNAISLKNLSINAGSMTATSGTLNLSGDFTDNATYVHNNGLANFNGSAEQNITGTIATTFSNLTLNNASGLRVHLNTSISNTLTLTDGSISINPAFTLNISSGNAVAGAGLGIGRHIITEVNSLTGEKGFLRIGTFSGSRTFPVGSSTYYMPVLLNASGTNDFSVSVFPGATQNGEPNGSPFSALTKESIVDATWVVNRNSGSSSTTMQLNWPAVLEGITFQGFTDPELGISFYDGSSWDSASGSGDQASNFAARNAIISFGPFGVGKTGIPLGMKFKSISVHQLNKGLEVDGTTLNEIDIDHYEIERSTDGRHFNSIGRVDAIGSTASEFHYSWVDIMANGPSYFYRIKAVDGDGHFNYSSIVRIDLTQQSSGVNIFPNPVRNGDLSFHSNDLRKGKYSLVIFNSTGQQVYSQQFTHSGGAVAQLIELPQGIPAGYYLLQLKSNGIGVITKPFILQ